MGEGGGHWVLGHGPPGWWLWSAAQACRLCPTPAPVVSCGWLPPPSNGHKEGMRYLVGSTVHFHCDSGYSLAGAEASTCQTDGTWSQPTPTCQRGEDAPPTYRPLPSALGLPPALPRPRARPAYVPCTCAPTHALRPAASLGRSYAVLLGVIFGGLAVVALVALVYVLLCRRKSNT